MRIGGEERIGHSAAKAFIALRDQQRELAQYLPNVESVEVLEREEKPPLTRLYNRWQGSDTEVPKAVRPFVGREMMAWFDDATWNEETLSCEWKLQSVKAGDIFACSGTTTLAADGPEACIFRLEGELSVYPDKIPGVPGFIARRIREPMESFVANLLRPNLTKTAGAVQQYLDAKGG